MSGRLRSRSLGVERYEIAKLQRLGAGGIDEVPVAVVDYDEIASGVEFRPPGFARRALKGVAG
jgi:hypothetical protein